MKRDSSIIICVDESELTERRNDLKKRAKKQGCFIRVDHNTVILKHQAVTFVVNDEETVFDDEHFSDEQLGVNHNAESEKRRPLD
jgi:hypothetical protein